MLAASDTQRCRIAHVEDNPADVFLLRHALDTYEISYELDVLPDGLRAMQYVEGIDRGEMRTPDLFILDLNLPIHNGLEVLKRIRASARIAAVPTVILTTSEAEPDWEAAWNLGVELYLRKPTNLDDFTQLGRPLKALIQRF
jgi:CheY-like chemotaxis protein